MGAEMTVWNNLNIGVILWGHWCSKLLSSGLLDMSITGVQKNIVEMINFTLYFIIPPPKKKKKGKTKEHKMWWPWHLLKHLWIPCTLCALVRPVSPFTNYRYNNIIFWCQRFIRRYFCYLHYSKLPGIKILRHPAVCWKWG